MLEAGHMFFDFPPEKRINVIVDTDAACEADDPYAIVHALLSPKLTVKGICAEHYNEQGSTAESLKEIKTILKAMDMDVPAYMGQTGPLDEYQDEKSEAVSFIIEEAHRIKERKPEESRGTDENHGRDCELLYILCQGAITNVAAAFRADPSIIPLVRVIWIGTHGAGDVKAPFREFNAGNDITAANEVLTSGADIWLIPSTVYTTINIGIAELKRKVAPCGEIGRHLYENLVAYNMSDGAWWTQGESWSLGDSPAIATAINPGCGRYSEEPAPHVEEDTSSSYKADNPVIRVYKDVDSRYILEDLFAKLELFTGR